jgi:hypothetical protein
MLMMLDIADALPLILERSGRRPEPLIPTMLALLSDLRSLWRRAELQRIGVCQNAMISDAESSFRIARNRCQVLEITSYKPTYRYLYARSHLVTSGSPTIRELSPGGSKSICREVKGERLAIIRYNDVPVEYIYSLSKRQIIGYLAEVPTVFPLLHLDALEQESSSCHLHTHGSHIPVAWDNFCLPNFKVASLVQVSQQAESEFHVLRETTVKRPTSRLPYRGKREPPVRADENSGLA